MDRMPPQNVEAEQAVLGSCMLDKDAAMKTVEIVSKPDDFYLEAHKIIYRNIINLLKRGDGVDLLTLSNELKKEGNFDLVGGSSYLVSLLDVMSTVGNVEYYSNIIKEKSILRNLIKAGSTIIDLGFNEKANAYGLLDEAESTILKIANNNIRKDFRVIKDSLYSVYEKVSELAKNKSHITGVQSFFNSLDYFTAGFQPSDLIILAGRPGMGKTAFALNIALNVVTKGKVPVGFFSLEMSESQLVQRLLCQEASVDGNRMRTGYLGERDWSNITDAMNVLSEAPLYIDDTPNMSIIEMRAKARRLHKNKNIGLLVIDYIQLMNSGGRAENRNLEVSDISRQLKGLAKELNIPIICLSQLSRRVEERQNKRPLLSDLRESGSIEQDADIVMFMYRDSYYNSKEGDMYKNNKTEVILSKHRNGPQGTANLAFIELYTKFTDIEEEKE